MMIMKQYRGSLKMLQAVDQRLMQALSVAIDSRYSRVVDPLEVDSIIQARLIVDSLKQVAITEGK